MMLTEYNGRLVHVHWITGARPVKTRGRSEEQHPASRTIIRRNQRGNPDDLVLDDVTCFRMERMDRGLWWLAAYRGERRVAIWLRSVRPISASLAEDELGCVDDG